MNSQPQHVYVNTPDQILADPKSLSWTDSSVVDQIDSQKLFQSVGFGRALTLKGNVYEGTVPAHVIAKRRAKNKVAKQTRKMNRSK